MTSSQVGMPADTWVLTSLGWRRIADLIDTPVQLVVDGKPYDSEGFFHLGVAPVVRVVLHGERTLRVAAGHPVLTGRVTVKKRHPLWAAAASLTENVFLSNNREFVWPGAPGDEALGYACGHFLGDGNLSTSKSRLSRVEFKVWDLDTGHAGPKNEILRIAQSYPTRSDFRGWSGPHGAAKWYSLSCVALTRAVSRYVVGDDGKTLSPAVGMASAAFLIGFIRGLFDTDGSVQGTQAKGVSVRLWQANHDTLVSVQRMLGQFGINSTIYWRRPEEERLLPDGAGGKKKYRCLEAWELVIACDNIGAFARVVGFRDEAKGPSLTELLAAYRRRPNRERFVERILNVEKATKDHVFGVEVPGIHAFDANGIFVADTPKNDSSMPLKF
jgi:ribonucleoside-diphosphate reductase alpha chain